MPNKQHNTVTENLGFSHMKLKATFCLWKIIFTASAIRNISFISS